MQASVNDFEKYEFVAENIEAVSRCLCRCKILEHLYLGGTAAGVEQLESALVRLYGAVLICLMRFKNYFNQKKAGQYLFAWLFSQSSHILILLLARLISSILNDKGEFQASLNDIIKGQDDVNQCAALICREGESTDMNLKLK
jgi:hypothetical protein